jgi:2-C-methyl-D-erythritol 4-phosphate cytidylyltransferase
MDFFGNRLKTLAIIPSAGLGRRMGSRKKNYLPLLGRPVLAHTLDAFERAPAVDAVIVAVAPSDEEYCRRDIVERYGFRKVVRVVAGGAERQDTVRLCLGHAAGWEMILVHDGARPLVTPEMIEAVVNRAVLSGSAITAVPVKDTVKEVRDGLVKATVPRAHLVSVQTPQAFRSGIILKAFEAALADGFMGTDESSLVERLGETVAVVEGSHENIKITTGEDVALAECLLRRRGLPAAP